MRTKLANDGPTEQGTTRKPRQVPPLFRFGHREGEWCITHKANDPRDIVDPDLGMRSLKLQSGLRSSKKPLRFGLAHDPLAPLFPPSRTGTYFAPKIDQYRVPNESNGWHAVVSYCSDRESYNADESQRNTGKRIVPRINSSRTWQRDGCVDEFVRRSELMSAIGVSRSKVGELLKPGQRRGSRESV
jgi:hypothetical protein